MPPTATGINNRPDNTTKVTATVKVQKVCLWKQKYGSKNSKSKSALAINLNT